MADQSNVIRTTVEIDVNNAQQEIVKLNAAATDSTKSLEDRLKAKNKQVEIQTQLSKTTISQYEEELKLLEGVGASEKEIEKVKKKLNSERLKATRLQENGEKTQRKLTEAYKDSVNPIKQLDGATGGLLGRMQAIVTNPIGAVLTALVGIFALFKKAINSSEDGAASFNAIMAAIGQIFTNLITLLSKALTPVIEFIAKFFANNLNPVFEKFSGFVEAGKSALQGFLDYVNLLLTPLKALIAAAQAAALAIKGDFDGAKQVMVDFKDSVVDTAKSMVSNFVEAGQKTVETINDIGTAFKNASADGDSLISRAAAIELAQNALNKAKREQQLQDARLNTLSKEALRDAKDMEKSIEDRKKALEDYIAIEEKRTSRQRDVLNEEIRLQKERMSLGNNTREDEEALNQLLIQRENLNASLAERETQFLSERKALLGEEKTAQAAAIKAAEDQRKKLEAEEEARRKAKQEYGKRDYEAQLELDELDIERQREKGARVLELELELLDKRKELELQNTELTERERQLIIQRYSDQAAAIKAREAQSKIKSEEQYKKGAINAAAEAFGVSKEVSLAQMLMAAPQAIGQSFKKASETYPFPVSLAMGAAGAAGTVAPIIKGIKDIRQTKVKGISSSGGGGGGGSVNSAPKSVAITDVAANNAARLGTDPSLSSNATQDAAASVSAGRSPEIVFSEGKYNEFKQEVGFKEDKTTY